MIPTASDISDKAKKFLKKYFWEGQKLDEKTVVEVPPDAAWETRFIITHRRAIGLAIPPIFFHLVWWCLAIRHNIFQYFPLRYPMSITMIFGSFVAGATCEGSGAIAFPVMTLALHISASVARDFSIMIQSFGMTSASFTILWMGVKLEWHSIIFCSIGGVVGLVLGLEFVDPYIEDKYKKMFFVSMWASFAVALFIANRRRKFKTFDSVPNFTIWKAVVLVLIGVIGGFFTSLAGSGVDICSFAVLTLLFMVSEKIATPTSVILMAFNTVTGFFWRQLMMEGISDDAWHYLAVCVPISVITGPIGCLVSSHFHRVTLACMIYVLELIALVSWFIIVQPGLYLALGSVGVLLGGSVFFILLGFFGLKLAEKERAPTAPVQAVKRSSFDAAAYNNPSVTVISLTDP